MRTAQVVSPPAVRSITGFAAETLIGTALVVSVVFPLPICPAPFAPQHNSEPVVSSTHVWFAPVAICVALFTPGVAVGTERSVFEPSPI